ncbi:hypothetical protein FE257_002769 [Aspergillus nanangensis]|uniref:Helicase C-terminal domain-containing protein n=1 Tax=Aspergillus nanangensis TaxID=2582783 RepID=A0AAD4CDN4_ASPNN|nr:hypothetical protein FE257_002769 [Aspergillus nanangensis]
MPFKRKTPFKPMSNRPSKRPRRPLGQTNPPPSSRSTSPTPPTETESTVASEIPEIVHSLPYSGPKSTRTQLALGLPPLFKLGDIYRSITARALELNLDDFLSHIGSRPLRVVTVCSGTESPLLSLEMVQENLRTHFEKDLNFRHLFSAEIVPFKQAYIERNFHPRFIFRDVAELKDRVAQTAYGSLEKIPKNADILIAGFSCVDFSCLNNKRKTLDDQGESSGTFWGIVRYARTYRPRMVILENVKTAPWEKIEHHWAEIDYFAVHVDVDTKAYYLPQTRERGYMFCVDRGLMARHGVSEEDIMRWKAVLGDFKRPASSPAGMFLMDTDDRRLELIEKDMAGRIALSSLSSSSSARTTVNWVKYQVRHQSYRLNHNLGHRRPVSKSQDDGTCQMPDFAWQTWVRSLPERVWDTIDVNFLRKLVEGYDMNYKERCLELSQGLDREIDSRAYGIVGCITPCGIPYITTRGGPLCGLESLALQGLPLDRLLLTRESQRELQDLAGNAMSSTVVGCAILAALIVGYKLLEKGEQNAEADKSTSRIKSRTPRDDYELVPSPFTHSIEFNVPDLQAQAARSARYCACERQSGTKRKIHRCTLCEHTACDECAGNPVHAYERWANLERSQPLDFVSKLKDILPSRLVVSGITSATFDLLKSDSSIECSSDTWKLFLDAVSLAIGDELCFLGVKRSEIWTISYEGKYAILDLVIDRAKVDWFLYAKPSGSEPTLCLIREILLKPFAHSTASFGALLEGDWEVCAPMSAKTELVFSRAGSTLQSYESKCGLESKKFHESKIWTQIRVQGSDQGISSLKVDVRGLYELLPDCGTANACLHKKEGTAECPPLYLFLDPTKLGEPVYDSFVFSLEHRRNPAYVARLTVAEISHRWRSAKSIQEEESVNIFYRRWIRAETARLVPSCTNDTTTCWSLKPGTTVSISSSGCHDANITLLSFNLPMQTINTSWKTEEWEATDPTSSPTWLRELSWLFQKSASLSGFQDWSKVPGHETISSPPGNTVCGVCIPAKPRILWGRNGRGWVKAYEDPHDAALYERLVKSRPPPFLVFRRIQDDSSGSMRITLNVQTLLHQALDKLRGSNNLGSASFDWRLVPNAYDSRDLVFQKFELTSNRNDNGAAQPPGFMLNLRPEQLRSLSWMINQEQENVDPFVDEETEEALLPQLMWRAEARVSIPKTVRGGVLADDVGYGKTAISEITKFLGPKYNVLVFSTANSFAKKSIRDVQECDIALVSWSVFNNHGYYEKMEKFTGMSQAPRTGGRNFDDWFLAAHNSLKEQIQILREQGPEAMLAGLHTKRQNIKDNHGDSVYVPSKRPRGKQYADAHQTQQPGPEPGMQYADISSGAEDSDSNDDKTPEVLRDKVDRFLKLQSQTQNLATASRIAAGNDSEDGESDHKGSTSESPRTGSREPAAKGAKRKRTGDTEAKKMQKWDDRKEFNIMKDGAQSWEAVRTPLLHAFMFNRLVIDEFTYANPDRLNPLLALQAHSRWVLSGTPPLNDFADVKTIAPFLDIHLGIDYDDEQSQNKRIKIIRKQRSDAETFQSFQPPRSEAWHRHRHEIAQRFLHQFARKNVAEIDEIPSTEHIVLVSQSPAEKAIYLELYKQLMTCNRQLRRSGRGKVSSDQLERLDEIISNSSTAEEALVKRCSSIALHGRWEGGKPEATTCKSLMEIREKQLADLKKAVREKLKLAAWVYCACDLKYEKFHKFIESVLRHDFGDMEVTQEAYPLIKQAIRTSQGDDWKMFFVHPCSASPDDDLPEKMGGLTAEQAEPDTPTGLKGRKGAKAERTTPAGKCKSSQETRITLPKKPTQPMEFEPVLREATSSLRGLFVEWVLRVRALRFLRTVRLVQAGSGFPQCDGCEVKPIAIGDVHILGSCGHSLCCKCIVQTCEKEECAVEGCRGSGKKFNIIDASTLGRDEDRDTVYGGSKLDRLVGIIHAVAAEERALLFIQYPELMEIASKALDLAGIKHTMISSADRKSIQKIERFQKNSFGEDKVLILNLGSEMAAGLNLQCANHVIFISPMLAQTQYDYDSAMTQAIGRCRRYGQTRHVHVYHILAKATIDVNIFQDHRDKVLVERDGEAILVSRENAADSELMSCQGPSLMIDNAF